MSNDGNAPKEDKKGKGKKSFYLTSPIIPVKEQQKEMHKIRKNAKNLTPERKP